jgi:hypothetical protein
LPAKKAKESQSVDIEENMDSPLPFTVTGVTALFETVPARAVEAPNARAARVVEVRMMRIKSR